MASLPISNDCMVLSYMPDWAHGDVDNIGVANNDGGVRTLLNWRPIATQDASSPDRRFVIALYSRKTTAAGKTGPILAFEISEDWPERTSWKSQPDYAPDPAANFKFVPGEGWKLFDITSVVHSQAESGGGKHGVLLRWLSEDRSGQKRNWSGYQFVSREGTGRMGKPSPAAADRRADEVVSRPEQVLTDPRRAVQPPVLMHSERASGTKERFASVPDCRRRSESLSVPLTRRYVHEARRSRATAVCRRSVDAFLHRELAGIERDLGVEGGS